MELSRKEKIQQPAVITPAEIISLYKQEHERGRRIAQLREALSEIAAQDENSSCQIFDNGLLFITYLPHS